MKILIVEDEEIFRSGLVRHLPPETEIGEAGICAEACTEVRNSQFDCILLDLGLPDATGLEALIKIREINAETPIVVISAHESPSIMHKAVGPHRAQGYIPKSHKGWGILVNVIQIVRTGGYYVPAVFLDEDIKLVAELTPRETDVLSFLVKGDSDKAIANQLDITESTVSTHLDKIYKKLRARNRTDAVQIARDLGFKAHA